MFSHKISQQTRRKIHETEFVAEISYDKYRIAEIRLNVSRLDGNKAK